MRFLLAIFFFYAFSAFAQEKNDLTCQPSETDTLVNLPVFRFVDTMPSVEGGMPALLKQVSGKIKYPGVDRRLGVETKVIVAFIIDPNGKVIGKRIIKNIAGTDIGEQVLNIVSEMKWRPGTCEGKPVHVLQVIPMIIETG